MSRKNNSTTTAVETEVHMTTKDFSGHVDENQFVVRESLYKFEKSPFPIAVDFRNTTVVVGPADRQYTKVLSARECNSVMSAANNLIRGDYFAHVEPGLHLHCPKDQIKSIVMDTNVGVIGSRCVSKGENDPFNRFVPTEGRARLGVAHGCLTNYPIVYHPWVPGTVNEPWNWGKDRNTIALHDYMDELLAGKSFHLQPNFYKGDREFKDGDMTLTERQAAWVTLYKGIWEMTDEEARESYAKNVLNKGIRRSGAILHNEQEGIINNGGVVKAALKTVPLHNGEEATFEDLKGHTVQLYFKQYGEITGLHIVGVDTTWEWLTAMVVNRHLNVKVLVDIPVVAVQ